MSNEFGIVQVEKQSAKFYTIHVDQQTIDEGFIIAAHSPAVSKFKLLFFEQTPEGQWELIRQVWRMSSRTTLDHRAGQWSVHAGGPSTAQHAALVLCSLRRRIAARCTKSQQPRSSSCTCRR